MTLVEPGSIVVRGAEQHRSRLLRWLGPGWPLKLLLLGFPLWWALGLSSIIFFVAATVMAVQMVRRGRLRVPAGFGVWMLFLMWVAAGVFVLWVHAPGTVEGGGPGRLVGFGFWLMWYLSITVAMLYPLSFPSGVLPAMKVVDWLGYLFLVVAAGGVLGVLFPTFSFTSPMELILPGAQSGGFLHTMVHPSLATASDFLGFQQPRPNAPFAYPNAWGNNFGLLLPFFVLSWAMSPQRWKRLAVPAVVAVAIVPVVLSLNRGVWIGLGILVVYAAVNMARARQYRALMALLACIAIAALVVLISPLADIVQLRVETPHSNGRRSTVADTVTSTTWEGSPLLGYGSTRQVQGNFESIAGGETPNCHQCAAPPMGTQGFLWRLIFTTGFVGTGLFYLFLAIQLVKHVRRRDAISIVGCMVLTMSLLFFFVYDSLESPLFILMLAIGLMNRERLEDDDRHARMLSRAPN
ncbi:MAG: hypothetical protein WAN48_02835 [Actinomycetes bacterium]